MAKKNNPFEEKHIRKAVGNVFTHCITLVMNEKFVLSTCKVSSDALIIDGDKQKVAIKKYIDEHLLDDSMEAFKKDGYNTSKEDWDAFFEEWWEKGV